MFRSTRSRLYGMAVAAPQTSVFSTIQVGALESRMVGDWRLSLLAHASTRDLVIHRNRPYRGWTDGLTTALRREIPEGRYAGIELEVSQALMPPSRSLSAALVEGLSDAVRRLAG